VGLTSEQIESYVLNLPVQERARLAERLLFSLDSVPAEGAGSDPEAADVEAAWLTESHRRIAEVERGEALPIPAEEVMTELRARYRR